MASYFDEHDCRGGRNLLLEFVRIYLRGGEVDLTGVTEHPAPPASQAAVASLSRTSIQPSDVAQSSKCPVCLLPFDVDEEVVLMPCKHRFHEGCMLPWLQKTNSCPVCRYELPTDDPDYESYRKEKERSKVRDQEIEILHDSMYG